MAVPPKLVNQIVSTLDSSKPVNQKVEEVIELLQASGFAHLPGAVAQRGSMPSIQQSPKHVELS